MRVAIFPAEYTAERYQTVRDVCDYLKSRGASVYTYKNNSAYSGPCELCDDFRKMMLQCDLVVAVGGDGTMLHAAKHACDFDKPVLGVNCGRLGYLSTIEKSETELIGAFLDGESEIDERMLLSIEHTSADGTVKRSFALNDAVLGGEGISKALDVSVCCDGRPIYDFTGDGIVFATPTGSTAYAFSAGGPVVDPQLRCVCVTPVCPHSFTLRSVIFSSPSVITARCSRNKALLAVDGENAVDFYPGDWLTVKCSELSAKFVKLKPRGFYDVLAEKMDR